MFEPLELLWPLLMIVTEQSVCDFEDRSVCDVEEC